MQPRETNLQIDWENLVKEHNLGVKELEKKKEELKVEEQTIIFQKLDIKRQTELCQAKDTEIIKSHDLIKKQNLKIEKQETEIINLKKDTLEASKGLWTTQEVEKAIEEKENLLEATKVLLEQKDKDLMNLKVNMGESLVKINESKVKLQEKINREKELTEEKEKLEEKLKNMEDKIESGDKDLKKTLNNFSKRNAILEQEVEEAKKLKIKF